MSLNTVSVDKNVGKSPFVTPEGLLQVFKEQNIEFQLYHHKAVFSVSEADKVDMAIPGAHTRNLFVRDKKENMFLITLMANTKIDLGRLAELIGAGRLSFGSPDRLMKYLGVTPGSVTPFSVINDADHKVTLILDKAMMEAKLVNYHPLLNTMTVGLTPASLLTFLENCKCKPQITDLSPASGD